MIHGHLFCHPINSYVNNRGGYLVLRLYGVWLCWACSVMLQVDSDCFTLYVAHLTGRSCTHGECLISILNSSPTTEIVSFREVRLPGALVSIQVSTRFAAPIPMNCPQCPAVQPATVSQVYFGSLWTDLVMDVILRFLRPINDRCLAH